MIANATLSTETHVRTPVSPAVRYSIQVDNLSSGTPEVRINGEMAEVDVTGTAVLPAGTGSVILGDITAADGEVVFDAILFQIRIMHAQKDFGIFRI